VREVVCHYRAIYFNRHSEASAYPAPLLLGWGLALKYQGCGSGHEFRKVVLEQGYLASQVAKFLACHPSNVSRALQK
jgi:hypothetical protein